jgi:aerobic carbon-monoxide dehydrogenase medium subunit
MKLPEFDYRAPRSLEEAVALLSADEDARIISGGQSLMPVLAFRMAYPSTLVDLRRIDGLNAIEISAEGLKVGARVRWVDIQRDARLAEAQPLFQYMISHVAHTQVRNRGTVGGSIAHADPAAEMPGVALVCDCVIEVVGPSGKRDIAAGDMFLGPLETTLKQGEIITGVRFPAWKPGRNWAFIEIARRKGDFAMAGIAAFWDAAVDGTAQDVHVGAIGAGSTPLRLSSAEAVLEGRKPTIGLIAEAAEAAMKDANPMGDIHGDAEYRRALVGTLTARALTRAAGLEH